MSVHTVWARELCRISPPLFLAECCKRQLNQGSFVLLYFRLSTFSDLYWVCLSVFSCTVLFVSISQVIGCEDRLQNDLYCVEWGVKLYSNQPSNQHVHTCSRRDTDTCSAVRSWDWPGHVDALMSAAASPLAVNHRSAPVVYTQSPITFIQL